jgi:hypothetical protein
MAVTAAALTAGAAQLALGHDLGHNLAGNLLAGDLGRNLLSGTAMSAADASGAGGDVNRIAKGDRMVIVGRAAGESQTVSVRVGDLANTSVLIRLNSMARRDPQQKAPAVSPANAAKKTFACEPTVSLLTEVAKQLAPARCLT